MFKSMVDSIELSSPQMLFRGVMRFIGEHSFFRAFAPFPFLTPDFFDPRSFCGNKSRLVPFDFIEKQFAREEAI